MNNTKEVRFDQWCHKCEHYNEPETDDHCNDCLAQSWNIDSTKPLYFKDNGKEENNGSNNSELHQPR